MQIQSRNCQPIKLLVDFPYERYVCLETHMKQERTLKLNGKRHSD